MPFDIFTFEDVEVSFVQDGDSSTGPHAISSKPCKWPCKILFCIVYYTVCRVKFEIVSEIKSGIGSLLDIVSQKVQRV